MPVIDQNACPVQTGSGYPDPYAQLMAGRSWQRLGRAGGLTQFGANLVRLAPGGMSSLRHWHTSEDEFVMVVQGVCTLVQDAGETEMHPGDCAAFPAGDPDGHHFINRTAVEARFLVVGTRVATDVCTYSDVDMRVEGDGDADRFTHWDGTPWQGPR